VKRLGRCRLSRLTLWSPIAGLTRVRTAGHGHVRGSRHPFAPAPYRHCIPSSLTSLWAGTTSEMATTVEGRVSLCRAESSAIYFHVLSFNRSYPAEDYVNYILYFFKCLIRLSLALLWHFKLLSCIAVAELLQISCLYYCGIQVDFLWNC